MIFGESIVSDCSFVLGVFVFFAFFSKYLVASSTFSCCCGDCNIVVEDEAGGSLRANGLISSRLLAKAKTKSDPAALPSAGKLSTLVSFAADGG